jgi:hypothetical protein
LPVAQPRQKDREHDSQAQTGSPENKPGIRGWDDLPMDNEVITDEKEKTGCERD